MNQKYKARETDYVGVAAGQPQFSLATNARNELDSTGWAVSATIPVTDTITTSIGDNKCNVFVYHMAMSTGVSVPLDSEGLPPRAYNWYDSGASIAGWI